jgi:hypothetical protein
MKEDQKGMLPKVEHTWQSLADPAPEAGWELWYQDLFDRECPPSVDVRGRGLVRGLMELWARYLRETVGARGNKGFSRFHLWSEGRATGIDGDWQGAIRLREWVLGTGDHYGQGYIEAADAPLLEKIAITHAHLVVAEQPGELILATAAAAVDREDLQVRLLDLTRR